MMIDEERALLAALRVTSALATIDTPVTAGQALAQTAVRCEDAVSHAVTSSGCFERIATNPPFNKALDPKAIHPELKVRRGSLELIFINQIIRLLAPGARAVMIVPENTLFGRTKAHRTTRRTLVDECRLEAVIRLPGGAFHPHANVQTSIIAFTAGDRTERVFFYQIGSDDEQSNKEIQTIAETDAHEAIATWQARSSLTLTDRTSNRFDVSAEEIRKNDYSLTLKTYRAFTPQITETEDPATLIKEMIADTKETLAALEDLEKMLTER